MTARQIKWHVSWKRPSPKRRISLRRMASAVGYLIYNIKEASEMPKLAEPRFLYFEATVEFLPVMLPEDLKAAGLEEINKKWS